MSAMETRISGQGMRLLCADLDFMNLLITKKYSVIGLWRYIVA